ncbi:MAG TPA: alpha/beta hydrolase [Acidimicrobiia bacterium]|nr:alpha/beta hydrolase [Acidimicrobiia bacterium]
MPTAEIDGTHLAYEIVGDPGGRPWVLTPGGRFSKDSPGIRALAEALAAEGQRVLIWDRPNCGASDVCFTGDSESAMQADHLAGLLRHLDLAPAVVVGGSGGARVSLLTAAHHPDVASALAMLWISGGVYGLLLLATHYCGESIRAAWQDGMEAVAALPEWAEVLERNPRNRERFLALDPQAFIATLERWMLAYVPDASTTVPGITDAALDAVAVPTLVFRSGESDPHHTRATSERLAALIPGAQLVEPPWPDDEWKQRGAAAQEGTGHLFERWPLLAPQLLDFASRSA